MAGRPVGPGHPCLVIAEAGVNHNGDPALARRLVGAAADAGADAVKFQTWDTDRLVTRAARMADYQKRNTGTERSQYDMLRELELPRAAHRPLRDHAADRGAVFLSTPDEEDSADFLAGLGVPAFKVGSGEVTNLPFLAHVARHGRPVILSTGMADLGEVERAVRAVEDAGNTQLVLLHCVSCYPAEPADCNLRALDALAAAFGYPVGFSDHTLGSEVALAAVARGACVLEKHLTLDTTLPGPDHAASLDPAAFRALVQSVRTVEAALGDGRKRPRPAELPTKAVVQKSLVAARPLGAGARLRADDLVLRRSSGGLPPGSLPLVVGRELARDLGEHEAVSWEALR
ncbi:MAG: N-acetylneuraminate synthase [Isosphaera sp.]|nr:N-acetylneuraminate synthase [Isosphaera sp.]